VNINNQLKNNETRTVYWNIASLFFLQIANYVLPLITIPYLIRVIGIDNFGLISLAMVLVSFFAIFIDFGFNLSISREISIFRNDIIKRNTIFNTIITIRLLLIICSFMIFLLIINYIDKFSSHKLLFILYFFFVSIQSIFPTWFFQGLENLRVVSLLSIVSKSIYTLLIFFVIKNINDILYIPILGIVGEAFIFIVASYILKNRYKIIFKFSLLNTRAYIKMSYDIFISNFSMAFFFLSPTVFLGFVANNTIVGIYSIGEKIISAIKGLLNPFVQALYPYLSKKINDDKFMAIKIIKKLLHYTLIAMTIMSILIFVYAVDIVALVSGHSNLLVTNVVKIMFLIPLIVGLSNIYGKIILLGFSKADIYGKIYLLSGVFSIFIQFFLISNYNQNGAAISMLITELLILVLMIMNIKKMKLLSDIHNEEVEYGA